MKLKKFLKHKNTANIITLSRLAFVPLLITSGLANNKKLFLTFFSLHGVIDVVDGFVARRLKIASDFGRRLDTLTDICVYVTGKLSFIYLIREEIAALLSRYYYLILVPLATYGLQNVLSYIYLRRFSSFHLYTSKFAGLPLTVFFIVTLMFKFYAILLIIAVLVFVISNIEASLIYLLKKGKTDENLLSIFQLVKS